jgi:CDGSH-type Zn-finger protein
MSEKIGGKRAAGEEPVTITPYRDGPYLVRGTFGVRDQDGNEVTLERRTIALCRCGKSRMRPFCDGTHRLTGFKAPSSVEAWPPEGRND